MKLTLDTNDKTHPKFFMHGIKNDNFPDVIRTLIEKSRELKKVREFLFLFGCSKDDAIRR